MPERQPGYIPVDALVVARKVMTGSRSNLQGEVNAAVETAGLASRQLGIREAQHTAVSLIEKDEYASRKLGHQILSIHSVVSLVDNFNAVLDRNKEGMNDFVSDVALGEADFEIIDDGLFVIGFLMSDDFSQRITRERTQAIDTLLDAAKLPLTDPIRHWRFDDDFNPWLPVLEISTKDPAGESIVEDFVGQLEQRTASLAIDFFDVKARLAVVDLALNQISDPQPGS